MALGRAVDAIQEAVAGAALPATVHGSLQGTARVFQSSLESQPMLILLALLAVYIVLGVLYESYVHPLTILSTLPSAGVGALLALLILAALLTVYIVLGVLYESYIHPITILSTLPSAGVGAILALELTGKPFDVISLIGIVLLIGIVKKNAIMMIDFALEAEREQHMSPEQSIYQACLLRFRPIMMTTMAALLGGLPLALGAGTGAELRRPLGITIVGGLLVSQVLTLYTTPVIYLMMDRIARRFSRQRGAPDAMPEGQGAG